MGDGIRRWLVPDTPRRKAWQALAYLLIIAAALTAAGVKYATTSYPAHTPAGVATTPGGIKGQGGAKGHGTEGPAPGRSVIPSRSYTTPTEPPPSHRTASSRPRPSALASPAGTPSPSVTASPAPVTATPAPSSAEPSASFSPPSESPSATVPPAPEITPVTTAPGALRLTA